jgi:PDZ domain-containing protein
MAQGRQLAPLGAVVPSHVDPAVYFKQQERLFEESEKVSAAAAARAAGYKVRFRGRGAQVAGLSPRSPASKVLKNGDVITRIDGEPVRLTEDVVTRIRSRPTGTTFTMTVLRHGRTSTVRMQSQAGIVRGFPGIGALLTTKGFSIDFPFDISFRKRDIGGPSAGLVYALAVYDMLNRTDTAHGRVVATTGTMDIDGRVGPIGGVEEKAIAAKRRHADIFLVPEEEVEGARGSGLDVRGVSTLEDAIAALRVKS